MILWVYLYLVHQHSEVIEVTAQLICLEKICHKRHHNTDSAGQGVPETANIGYVVLDRPLMFL